MRIACGCLLVLIVQFVPLHAAVAPPDCLAPYARQLGQVLAREEADEMFAVIGAFNSDAQAGTRAILDATDNGNVLYDVIFDVLERQFPVGSAANPFVKDEELFEVIGGMSQSGQNTVGFTEAIRKLTSSADDGAGFLTAQGAIFDFYMAKRISADGAGYSRIASMSDKVDVPDTTLTREPDIISLDGVHHENKNWTTPLSVASASPPVDNLYFRYVDRKVNQLASEFARDILIHGSDGFQSYRLNFRNVPAVAAQRDVIRALLRQQFDSPLVRNTIKDEDQIKDVLRVFDEQFDSIVGFY